jgi:hypothetical protein
MATLRKRIENLEAVDEDKQDCHVCVGFELTSKELEALEIRTAIFIPDNGRGLSPEAIDAERRRLKDKAARRMAQK